MEKPLSDERPLVGISGAVETLEAQKEVEKKAAEASQPVVHPVLNEVERYLADIFEDARAFKEDETSIQADMIDAKLRKKGSYSDAKLAQIRKAGSAEQFLPMTGVKCRAFEAFVHDIYMNSRKKRTWTLRPTPLVTIPETDRSRIKSEVMAAVSNPENNMTPMDAYKMASEMRAGIISSEYAEALKKSENMARLVHDQMIEGGWVAALTDVIMNVSTMKAGILKGPLLRFRKTKTGWNGKNIEFGVKEMQTFESVDPLNLYPSRYSFHPDDGTPICEKITMKRNSLAENRDKDGYVKQNIENIILYGSAHGKVPSSHASDRKKAENRDNIESSPVKLPASVGSVVEGIEYWCSVRGADLISIGIVKDGEAKDIDLFMDYEINAITVDGKLVFLDFNRDQLGRRPYSIAGFAREMGGFWYKGIPEILKDLQDIINAAVRAMVNNLSWSSGPQVIIPDINKLAPGEDVTSIFVGKIWQGIGGGTGSVSSKLVDFWQPDSRSAEMISIIQSFLRLSDEFIEMPSYSYGSENVGGAGRTSSGLSMLMSSSSRGMKRVILDIDRSIFQNVIEQLVDYNLENSDDDSIKGDMNFYSEGVISLIMKEQLSERRLSFLTATQNDFDMKVIGLDGRAKILADAIESLESDYDDIMPTEEKLEELIRREEILQQQAIQENQMKIEKERAMAEREAELKIMEAELKLQELEVEKRAQDLEFKAKERELDIRAEKQIGDRMLRMQEMGIEEQEEDADAEAE